MTTHPTATELLRAVIAWFDSDDAAGNDYLARVARNALGIVLRDMEFSPRADSNALSRLRALLGQEGDLPMLETELCARLRNGTMPLNAPGLLLHLRLQTLDRLAIDQPRYRHELHAAP
jgi:hypothetical protein